MKCYFLTHVSLSIILQIHVEQVGAALAAKFVVLQHTCHFEGA
jgi:hypothetical protein